MKEKPVIRKPEIVFTEKELERWILQNGLKVYRDGNHWRNFYPKKNQVALNGIKKFGVDLFGPEIIKNKTDILGKVDMVHECKTAVYLFELKKGKAKREDFSQAFSYLAFYESLIKVWKKLEYIPKGKYAPQCFVLLVAKDFDYCGAWVVPPKYENRFIPIRLNVTWSPTLGKDRYKVDMPIKGEYISIESMKAKSIPNYDEINGSLENQKNAR